MIANSKLNCITDIGASLRRTARWRRELQKKYSDHRNGKAAETLDKLADETNDLTDEAWEELKSYYNWASGTWSDAVSTASRHVEFRNVQTFPDFVNRLVDILSQDSVAA
jgi:hypothetical protein